MTQSCKFCGTSRSSYNSNEQCMKAPVTDTQWWPQHKWEERCRHERLDEDGICRACGEDCQGFHP